jgi:hypothetical protein
MTTCLGMRHSFTIRTNSAARIGTEETGKGHSI